MKLTQVVSIKSELTFDMKVVWPRLLFVLKISQETSKKQP